MSELDFGTMMSERKLTKGLQNLNPELTFDPAGKLGYYHPNMVTRQGIWLHERHLASMERGDSIPEYDVWAMVTLPNGRKVLSHIDKIGWRHTLQMIDKSGVLSWDQMCRELKIDYKHFNPELMFPDTKKPSLEVR